MKQMVVYCSGAGGTLRHAANALKQEGIPVVDYPTPEATHLLLDVPLKSVPDGLLERLPEEITVSGGNLDIPELVTYSKLDLLKDPYYLAQNAAITAECALRVAVQRLETVFSDTPVLVVGWGRIGTCLSRMLKALGCPVTVAARKEKDRAMLKALGYSAINPMSATDLSRYRLIFSTAPESVFRPDQIRTCGRCLKIDLASKKGLDGEDVLWARGLPGVYAPESSGKLIAETFLKLSREAMS